MTSWNILLKAMLLSLVFALTSAQANESLVLNINNASIEQLEKIKGIGAKKAQAIIEYRLKYGNFSSIDDLSKVKGIGKKFIAKNRPWMSTQ
jgi:competence protein ComEA